jgi:pimeloyl-[acyl-carrier protein] methyl ester esterase
MPKKRKLFLIPGWAVNSSVWDAVIQQLADVYEVCCYDFPGYGDRHALDGDLTLEQLVEDAIAQSPPDAIWMAWSLGTMVALEAARQTLDRIPQLILTCPTPKFMTSDDWHHGQTSSAIDNLSQRFEGDYKTALKRFLLLQAGTDADARKIAKATMQQIAQHPQPTWATLQSGLKILRQSDLRPVANQITTPTRIIVGKEDRVIPANAGIDLHQRINGSTLIELATGHAPFIEQPAQFIDAVAR